MNKMFYYHISQIQHDLFEMQRICGDNHYPIYERFEVGWLDSPRFVIDQILEDIGRTLR